MGDILSILDKYHAEYSARGAEAGQIRLAGAPLIPLPPPALNSQDRPEHVESKPHGEVHNHHHYAHDAGLLHHPQHALGYPSTNESINTSSASSRLGGELVQGQLEELSGQGHCSAEREFRGGGDALNDGLLHKTEAHRGVTANTTTQQPQHKRFLSLQEKNGLLSQQDSVLTQQTRNVLTQQSQKICWILGSPLFGW